MMYNTAGLCSVGVARRNTHTCDPCDVQVLVHSEYSEFCFVGSHDGCWATLAVACCVDVNVQLNDGPCKRVARRRRSVGVGVYVLQWHVMVVHSFRLLGIR